MVSFRPIERQFHRGEHNRQSFCSVWAPFHYHPVVWAIWDHLVTRCGLRYAEGVIWWIFLVMHLVLISCLP